jgi:monovalent cation:H+ antiporter-2, CPA2 family
VQEDFRLIIDLVSVLAAATVGGLLASLFRRPPLLGYLLGGMIVGPAGLGLIKEILQIETLAQFGVAFLLFALGVEFSFAEIKKVQKIALGGAGIQIALTIAVTVAVCGLTGAWGNLPAKGVFLGAILSLSSTAVVLKCLMESNQTTTLHGQIMLGILVVQDLALGLMLAVLPALDQPPEAIGKALGLALIKIALFAAGAIAVGLWFIPGLLRFLAKTESKELFLLGIVALCLGIALFTEYLGLSIEMGAFVAGLMISEVEYADQTLTYVEPLRDIFAALFFASIGMLIDPFFLWENIEVILGLVALVFLGKFVIITFVVRAFKYNWKTALITGLGLAQIGEFSFVLASEGLNLGLVSRRIYLLILGTTAVTLILTPFVLEIAPKLLLWAENVPFLKQCLAETDTPLQTAIDLPEKDHIVVCGYGKVGRNLVKLLQENQRNVVVIDESESNIQKLRDLGVSYVYGNPASLHVLETAGVSQASAMVLALPDAMSTRLALKRSLELAPALDIVVQANKDKDIELLYQLGAKEVVQPEFEASLEMATHLLIKNGLSTWLINEQMQQIRSSHYLDLRPQTTADQVSRELQLATKAMNSKWCNLPPESPLCNMSLEETNLRWLTGVTVVAIRRITGEEIDYPKAEVILRTGDRLLVVGENDELAAFDQLLRGEAAIPNATASCQWVVLAENSPVADQTLSEVHFRRDYAVQVQAIRREGKFIRFPGGSDYLKIGDHLLLCGASERLSQLKQWISPTQNENYLSVPLIKVTVSESLQEFLPMDTDR